MLSKIKNRPNSLSVNQGGGSSRFVVNLKKQIAEQENVKPRRMFGQKLKLIRFREPLKGSRNLYRNLYLGWYKSIEQRRNLNSLAFYNLLKLILIVCFKVLKWFYALCYAIGWVTVFSIRFCLLTLFSLARPLVRISKIFIAKVFHIFYSLGQSLIKGSKNLLLNTSSNIISRTSTSYTGSKIKLEKIRAITNERFEYALKQADKAATQININARSLNFSARSFWPRPKFSNIRPVVVFVIILIALVLPFKAFTYYKSLTSIRGQVLGESEKAINELLTASDSVKELDFNKASISFQKASNNFLSAQNELDEINTMLFKIASLFPSNEARLAANAQYIITAGEIAARLGSNLSIVLDTLFNNESDIGTMLGQVVKYGDESIALANSLGEQLKYIDIEVLPEEYQLQFKEIKERSGLVLGGLNEFIDLCKKAQIFLGSDIDKRYLFVFQNNAEMRGSGGFVGSFAIVDVSRGKIKNIEVPGGGSYDTKGALNEKILPPEPLHLLGVRWRFWDANWWPDWPKSARKLAWFYERSDGSTVDGVIGITPTVMERMLKVVGPIDMTEKYNIVIEADNFWLTVQEIVEEKVTGEKEPKQIIGDLMAKLIDELPARLNKGNLISLLEVVEQNLSEKHILFYFYDEELQRSVDDLGWSGRMKETGKDYLAVINTNIGGGKSDRKIKENIAHQAEILSDGTIINTLEIKRTHTGSKGESYTGVRNVDWMRIYVPLGSQLIEAHGFRKPQDILFKEPLAGWSQDPDLVEEEDRAQIHADSGTKIYNEDNYTVFANWSMVDPGRTTMIKLKYKLPFKMKVSETEDDFMSAIKKFLNPDQKQLIPYTLLVQKQPGAKPSEFTSNLVIDDNYRIVWQYPTRLSDKDDGWEILENLDVDKYWAALLEINKQ